MEPCNNGSPGHARTKRACPGALAGESFRLWIALALPQAKAPVLAPSGLGFLFLYLSPTPQIWERLLRLFFPPLLPLPRNRSLNAI